MNCPKCRKNKLIYVEVISGFFEYTIFRRRIDWDSQHFNGNVDDHLIRCEDKTCGYVLPKRQLLQVFEPSLKKLQNNPEQ